MGLKTTILPDTQDEQVEKPEMSGGTYNHSDKDSGGLDCTMAKQIVCPQTEEIKSKPFEEC